MKAHYSDQSVTLHHGDCLDVLRSLPGASVDAVVTDPPYGIGFMGKAWDAKFIAGTIEKRRTYNGDPSPKAGKNGGYRSAAAEAGRYDQSHSANRDFQLWCEAWARECFRVLKPGGHLLASGGSRTWHRLTAGIEDAGFEIRDSIAWLYGSGFPKSLNVSKAIDKAAGELAHESHGFTVAGRTEKNLPNPAFKGYVPPPHATDAARQWQGWGTALKPAFEPVVVARKPFTGTVAANVIVHGTGALNIGASRIGPDAGRWPANVILDESQATALDEQSGEECAPSRSADTGGASRFFYVAKADQSERPRVNGTAHPTVKPLDLMRWLVRLVTPPGGTVLEPFAGSGTTVEACIVEGFRCVAIEREADYLPLIESRIARRRNPVRAIELAGEDMGLFGEPA